MTSPSPKWRILVIEDDAEIARQVKEILEGSTFGPEGTSPEAQLEPDWDVALQVLERSRFDLVILDVLRQGAGGESDLNLGSKTLAAIRGRRFIPVVFYTALPSAVQEEESPPLVQIVEKSNGIAALADAVGMAFEAGLLRVNRELMRHVEEIQRVYMWGFVAHHWEEISGSDDDSALAYLLTRRLAVELSATRVDAFATAIGGAGDGVAEEKEPPMRQYLLPPLDLRRSGDLVQGSAAGRTGMWVVLTPTCDLVQEHAHHVLLAATNPLPEQPEVLALKEAPSGKTRAAVHRIIRNQTERFHFLAGALTLPDLVVDFQKVQSVLRAEFDAMQRVASIDSPYAESLVARFLRFYIRVGTPDLDLQPAVDRAEPSGPPAPAKSPAPANSPAPAKSPKPKSVATAN